MRSPPKLTALMVLGLSACTGISDLPGAGQPVQPPADENVGVSGIRRLSRVEYDTVVADLIADRTNAGFQALPADTTDPFDNDYHTQLASQALVDALETLATNSAATLVKDPARLEVLVQCTPTGPGDADCLKKFIVSFGRRALRRTLADDEVQRYLALQTFAVQENDFYAGVRLVVQAMLQDPEFVYRVEIGTPVDGQPGVLRLSQFELATRLSFFFWGTTPPDWLLDNAAAGQLQSTEQIKAAAQKLLDDPRARARVERFHSLWLSYWRLPFSDLNLINAMQTETNALVDKVVFDDPNSADYFSLFNADSTYVNGQLAQNYSLSTNPGTSFQWVSYAGTARKGILSHGAVLSNGSKFSDTSPTQRGIFVRTRLLCQDVAPPPPNVNVDMPPATTTSPCKIDRYEVAHASTGNCYSCHQRLDPIGFGLENYDRQGAYRSTDVGLPQCTITGNGTVGGLGDFNGPAGLEDLLVGSGQLEGCVTTQVYRFATGRRETPQDMATLENLSTAFKNKNRPFKELMLDFVSDPTFAFRQEEAP